MKSLFSRAGQNKGYFLTCFPQTTRQNLPLLTPFETVINGGKVMLTFLGEAIYKNLMSCIKQATIE